MHIRAAQQKDDNDILRVLEELDLSYPDQTLDNFWVAEKDGEIVGIAKLEEYEDFMFLSAVGVPKDLQGRGIAGSLLNDILNKARKKVYLYTLIPRFFEKHGFRITTPGSSLPARKTFHCRECTPEICVCMMK